MYLKTFANSVKKCLKKHERFIIYTKDLFCDGDADVTYLPLYMTMCL
ncbi:MAG: hypothetical protein II579_07340 [Treponema sp.]|nr:hypothetical protein [Treponema sp.]MBQ2572266.1 hypothetical protein [Treponema sp.]MBQ4025400.1 hypothetical protein [Treponema sp.]MBQ5450723.1 hypothetical protein [Treponema sp.]